MAEKGKGKAKDKAKETAKGKAEQEVTQEEDTEQRFVLRFLKVTRSFDLGATAIRFAGWALVLYMGVALPLRLTAGKTTIVNFLYGIVLDLKLHMIVPWAAAALFGGLWQWERRLRKKTVAREHVRTEEMERRFDPGRTSSGLTPMGDNPEGRP